MNLPFGDDLTCTGTAVGEVSPLHFTGKERDLESGLDYFGARYYGSSMGRFMSPDAPVDQHPEDPQSWNLYSYVRNNPLSNTDPTGNYDCGTGSNGQQMSTGQCFQIGYLLAAGQNALNQAHLNGDITDAQFKQGSAAISAYGTMNDGNGVTVNIGATGGFPGNTIAEGGGTVTAANPTGQNIQVNLNGGLFDKGTSPALIGAVAHEGSHVEDAEAWARAGFTANANPSNFKTEFAAYGVTIAIAQAFGAQALTGTKPGGKTSMTFWNSQSSSAQNDTMRSKMIKTFYPAWEVKAFGENTKGSGQGTK
jgi:RHS repeat-associated protein